MSESINIIVIESSSIVYEGLATILSKSGLKYHIILVSSLDEIVILLAKKNIDFIIINPTLILNNTKLFQKIKHHHYQIKWIALVYAYYDPNSLSMFDSIIYISDTGEMINASIQKNLISQHGKLNSPEPVLSDREIEVLKLLTAGLSNKEIADKLSISINTVITHRKNITQKTGIKSVSGLTIYAVVQKFITIDTIKN